MSNDVLIDMGDMNSLNSASSDDADAVNTESAKIYFGPLQSPEQKFASTSRLKTPVRKSTRLSSARAREHTHVNERVHQSTPTKLAERAGSSSEEDMLQDGERALVAALM